MTTTNHTPTPYAINPEDKSEFTFKHSNGRNYVIGRAFNGEGPNSEKTVAFIVKAANNHDALVEAFTELFNQTRSFEKRSTLEKCDAVFTALKVKP